MRLQVVSLSVLVGATGREAQMAVVYVRPEWPGKAYPLACPEGTSERVCRNIAGGHYSVEAECHEPEPETSEVINSFLTHCGRKRCLYIDIGCNIGYFAAQAFALGSNVECYEPTPMYTDAIRKTRRLNNGTTAAFKVINKAVVVNSTTNGEVLTFNHAYRACDIGKEAQELSRTRSPGGWASPVISLHSVLRGKHITLLKIDIDYNEGALLSVATRLIESGQTTVDTILVEYGDNTGAPIACEMCHHHPETCLHLKPRLLWLCENGRPGFPGDDRHPRGGDITDVHRLIHKLGYFVYRVNIVVHQEIFDKHGLNVNTQMSPRQEGLVPFYFVRSMKKLEYLSPDFPLERYPEIMRWGISLLITRKLITSVARKHHIDLNFAGLVSQRDLNQNALPS